ncbi:hypothetical protein ACFE04_013249 [Oxalis oulophora]
MWRFKPFMQKEPTGLEGRTIDVENLKIHVRNAIAQGGFSCVYLARDVLHPSNQYALKHIICNDNESLDLVVKEVSVMKSLKQHPNVVTLYAHTILDMGRTKEALLVMEFCEKSLVAVLETRGAGYFEELQVLSIFRDVCNAVFAMHSQSPPVAHRDLKAENLLLGPDGLWKLCDFGSTSTNHKRFEKPEEMGIEEDNIRKYTTPAYRAPEMWDLFRRELINEKVDIWALGCLLFRICYFKSAFDGESKLQVLNGNYRIPELPKYNTPVTDLIRDMLQASPADRPDITQASVWFRVNELLPVNLQKSLPDGSLESQLSSTNEGLYRQSSKSSPMPRRSPPPPPSSEETGKKISASSGTGGQLGAFWSTQHSKDEPTVYNTPKHEDRPRPSKDFELSFFEKDTEPRPSKSATFQNEAFNTFVADFDTDKLGSGTGNNKSRKEEALEAEIEKLKEKLRQSNMEKAEITSKYEKLSAICRSQRQEIHDLKAVGVGTFSTNTVGIQPSSTPSANSEWSSLSPNTKSWNAFVEDPKAPSVRTTNSHSNKPESSSFDSWGFETKSFTAVGNSSAQRARSSLEGNNSQNFGESTKQSGSKPAGWAGF